MIKASNALFTCLLCFFFCMAALEVDVFDYDNTFFDSYDSYVKADSEVTQHIVNLELDAFDAPQIILFAHNNSKFSSVTTLFSRKPRSANYFYRPKLFLIKSSFII